MSIILQHFDSPTQGARLCHFVSLWMLVFVMATAAVHAQEEPPQEFHQDFRGKAPLSPSFTLQGPDVDEAAKADDEGLRITLDSMREKNVPIEVATTFPIAGDFVITGTFEFLAGTRPTKGYGVGVHLYVADTNARSKFAKICRIMHPSVGSVYLAEYWQSAKIGKKDYQSPSQKTDAKTGQLRLARSGNTLRFLVSDGADREFREVYVQKNFGPEEMKVLRFGVADSGEPGNSADVRLIDLKIRMGPTLPDKALEPAPLAAVPIAPVAAAPVLPDSNVASKTRLVALLLLGLGGMLILGISAGIWIYVRRKSGQSIPRR